jgi:hypothetical protein
MLRSSITGLEMEQTEARKNYIINSFVIFPPNEGRPSYCYGENDLIGYDTVLSGKSSRFGCKYCLHLKGKKYIVQVECRACLAYVLQQPRRISTRNMWSRIQEGSCLHCRRCEDFKSHFFPINYLLQGKSRDRLCGLVVTVSGHKSRGPGFDSRPYQIFWEGGPLSLVRTIEELLEWKISNSSLENRD